MLTIDHPQDRLTVGTFFYMFSVVLVFAASIVVPSILVLNNTSLPGFQRDHAAQELLTLHPRLQTVAPVALLVCLGLSVLVSRRLFKEISRLKSKVRSLEADLAATRGNVCRMADHHASPPAKKKFFRPFAGASSGRESSPAARPPR